MTIYRPPALDKANPIVSPLDGRITPYFQRFWQNLSFAAADGGEAGSGVAALETAVSAINGQITTLNLGKVAKNQSTGWSAPTGTASKSGFSTYAAPTISNPPTQAEVQAIASHLQALSQHLKALIDGLMSADVIDI